MRIERIVAALTLVAVSGVSLAGAPPVAIAEPETLGLLAIAAAALAVARWLKRK